MHYSVLTYLIFLALVMNISNSKPVVTVNSSRILRNEDAPAGAQGKRVALFQVHFEGNVGDQMETIPLLKKLKEWGAIVDCYLSVWLQPGKRISPLVSEKVVKLVDNIYKDGVPYRYILSRRNYDLAIIAPGPTINEITYCFGPEGSDGKIMHNVSFVYFGISASASTLESAYERHRHCLKLAAFRESLSFDNAKQTIAPKKIDTRLLLSGDLSFSYLQGKDYVKPDLATEYPRIQHSISKFTGKEDWIVLFSRSNNFGSGFGVKVKFGNVYITTIDDRELSYPLEKVLFASTDALADSDHMSFLRNTHNVNTLLLHTVEELFALISSVPMVVTDRYHPGVATLIQDKKLVITKYKAEKTKMKGLREMMSRFSVKEMQSMNDLAFGELHKLLTAQSSWRTDRDKKNERKN